MKILRKTSEITELRAQEKMPIAFVPTMGALHDGHLALVQAARNKSDVVWSSLFVNPTQFNRVEDFERYPQTLDRDLELLSRSGVSLVFLPSKEDLYPDAYSFRVYENKLSKELCGRFRPGHFEGVLTVVLKLLSLTQPRWLFMGLKDYQQYELVRGMVSALFLPLEVIGVETVRESSGLAMSSRNERLNPSDRAAAARFPAVLGDFSLNPEECRLKLEALGFQVDYVEQRWGRRLAAIEWKGIRLIDNLPLNGGRE